MTDTLAILVAAGRGDRMGAARPKAFLLLRGEPLLLRAARAFSAAGALVAVVPAEEIPAAREILQPVANLAAVVAGGATRADSVEAGLAAAPKGFVGIVLVHDAARALVEPALVEAVAAAARRTGAAIPVLPVVDTIKRLSDGRVVETIDRSTLGAAQTPQGFRYGLLVEAYARARKDGALLTDEAMAVERMGEPVEAVAGSARNLKITTPADLRRAEDLLRREEGA